MALSHVMNIISNAGIVSAGTGSGGGGGGSSNLDSQTVTVGQTTTATGGGGLPNGTQYRRGYSGIGTTFGSISDGTSNIYSGASISQIQYLWDTAFPTSAAVLIIAGTNKANSGWTTLTIGTTSYQRASANYTADSGGNTQWYWYFGDDYNGTDDPFGNTGGTTTCVFT